MRSIRIAKSDRRNDLKSVEFGEDAGCFLIRFDGGLTGKELRLNDDELMLLLEVLSARYPHWNQRA